MRVRNKPGGSGWIPSGSNSMKELLPRLNVFLSALSVLASTLLIDMRCPYPVLVSGPPLDHFHCM